MFESLMSGWRYPALLASFCGAGGAWGLAPVRGDAQLGVYVDWADPDGQETNVEALESWLGRPIPMALDYFAC